MYNREKNLNGFWIWMILFIAFMFVPVFVDALLELKLGILYIMNEMAIAMAILTYMIYKKGTIYWYTGVMYEDFLKVSDEQIKAYAYKHMVKFVKFALCYLLYTLISYALGFHFGFDIVVGTIGLCVTAISTMNIHL